MVGNVLTCALLDGERGTKSRFRSEMRGRRHMYSALAFKKDMLDSKKKQLRIINTYKRGRNRIDRF